MILGSVLALASLFLLYIAEDALTKVAAGFLGVCASAAFAFVIADHYLLVLLYGLANLIGMLLSIWRE